MLMYMCHVVLKIFIMSKIKMILNILPDNEIRDLDAKDIMKGSCFLCPQIGGNKIKVES